MDLIFLTEQAVLPDWLIRMGVRKLLAAHHRNPRVSFSAKDTIGQDVSMLLEKTGLTETRKYRCSCTT